MSSLSARVLAANETAKATRYAARLTARATVLAEKIAIRRTILGAAILGLGYGAWQFRLKWQAAENESNKTALEQERAKFHKEKEKAESTIANSEYLETELSDARNRATIFYLQSEVIEKLRNGVSEDDISIFLNSQLEDEGFGPDIKRIYHNDDAVADFFNQFGVCASQETEVKSFNNSP